MIIQIGTEVDESRILWKHKESNEWEKADIDDLIEAYENRRNEAKPGDSISRQDLIDEILEDGNGAVLSYTKGMDEDELVERIEKQMIKHFIGVIEYAPPVDPKRPMGTETMIVDGMEVEIDPLSYEVGYTHGQFSERPKGEWIKATGVAPPEFAGRYVCSNCSSYALMNMPYGSRQKLSPFCPNCGADMRGDKE